MPGIINSDGADVDTLIEKASSLKGLDGVDCVHAVSCSEPYQWNGGLWDISKGFADQFDKPEFNVIALDLGVKRNILRNLESVGCSVTVLPATASASDILEYGPDGLFLSNGPGDPSAVEYVKENVKKLLGKLPIFGICLGHQILCLGMGARTFKLKFGHHGGNHPVMDLDTREVQITSQNHNFAVDPESLPEHLEMTHVNLNDNTLEGVRSKTYPVFGIQYHPEAAPGPHDASYLFSRFASLMKQGAAIV